MKTPLTQLGAELLREQLHQLKTEARPRIIRSIADARLLGDLKENAEYHAAKEEQSFVEGRIAMLEAKLAQAHIIDVTSMENNGKVIFGATVVLYQRNNAEEVTYKIVGEDEADLKVGKVSFNSPIAKALIGREEGESITVEAPGGELEYEVTEVRYI